MKQGERFIRIGKRPDNHYSAPIGPSSTNAGGTTGELTTN